MQKKSEQVLFAADRLVNAAFVALEDEQGTPMDKLWALVRAGKIAESYVQWSGDEKEKLFTRPASTP